MERISSYTDIKKRKKEISLQKQYLWDEIAHLHEEESEQKGLIKRALNIDPRILIGIWSFASRTITAIRRRMKDSPE
ncbi:MAG: hypothetical protein GVX78_04820 [Bacteroidetes bacterium]|jgi:hypothetical protein|nr:hypothetical protein [Bacteroidota bacterium]